MEDRQKMWDDYTGDKSLLAWSWLKYTRYFEANNCIKETGSTGLKVLDYGCGVGDMGIQYARQNADVFFMILGAFWILWNTEL